MGDTTKLLLEGLGQTDKLVNIVRSTSPRRCSEELIRTASLSISHLGGFDLQQGTFEGAK